MKLKTLLPILAIVVSVHAAEYRVINTKLYEFQQQRGMLECQALQPTGTNTPAIQVLVEPSPQRRAQFYAQVRAQEATWIRNQVAWAQRHGPTSYNAVEVAATKLNPYANVQCPKERATLLNPPSGIRAGETVRCYAIPRHNRQNLIYDHGKKPMPGEEFAEVIVVSPTNTFLLNKTIRFPVKSTRK